MDAIRSEFGSSEVEVADPDTDLNGASGGESPLDAAEVYGSHQYSAGQK